MLTAPVEKNISFGVAEVEPRGFRPRGSKKGRPNFFDYLRAMISLHRSANVVWQDNADLEARKIVWMYIPFGIYRAFCFSGLKVCAGLGMLFLL